MGFGPLILPGYLEGRDTWATAHRCLAFDTWSRTAPWPDPVRRAAVVCVPSIPHVFFGWSHFHSHGDCVRCGCGLDMSEVRTRNESTI